ncbi:MAG: prephenate dehydrogenase/arogenate dehydrogenase family protein [Gemmatimonadota bacterium]
MSRAPRAAKCERPVVAIIGLGLMGGSLARDLAERGSSVLAYDADPEVVRAALASAVITQALDGSFTGVREANIVVIATPVDRITATLERLAPALSTTAVVTDLGSTKAAVVTRAEEIGVGGQFVGSHPLAGHHRSGWAAARTGLYQNATVFLCATSQTEPAALAAVRRLWESVGARCQEMDAASHDRRMAWVSHLPQIAASAVAAALSESGHDARQLGPGGRDVTRLAASSPEMWTAISTANAEELAATVSRLRQQLASFEDALLRNDQQALLNFFRTGRDWLS